MSNKVAAPKAIVESAARRPTSKLTCANCRAALKSGIAPTPGYCSDARRRQAVALEIARYAALIRDEVDHYERLALAPDTPDDERREILDRLRKWHAESFGLRHDAILDARLEFVNGVAFYADACSRLARSQRASWAQDNALELARAIEDRCPIVPRGKLILNESLTLIARAIEAFSRNGPGKWSDVRAAWAVIEPACPTGHNLRTQWSGAGGSWRAEARGQNGVVVKTLRLARQTKKRGV